MRKKINMASLLTVIAVIMAGSFTSSNSSVSAGGLPIHFVAYFVLASAFLLNFHDTKKGHLEAILSAGLLALSIEAIQFFLPYRSFSFVDFVVSFAGASIITLDHHLGLVTKFIGFEDKLVERFLV